MNLTLPELAADVAATADRAIADAGGLALARRAFSDPGQRLGAPADVVARLGVTDLDPRRGVDEALAAAELCRVGGRYAFPYPLAAVLGRPGDGRFDFVALVDRSDAGWVEHADLAGRWLVVDEAGVGHGIRVGTSRRNRTLAPFVQPVELLAPVVEVGDAERAMVSALESSRVLGALQAAYGLARDHVRSRCQFGRPLADLQAVQFHLADCAVALRGLTQLARYTVWSVVAEPERAIVDALALRTFAQEASRLVLTTAELLHGAVGFCAEHDLTVHTRSIEAPLRLPTDLERTTELLVTAIDRYGFTALFDVAPVRPPTP